jgi:hypothetical protein
VQGWRTYEEAASELAGLPAEERLPTLLAQWSTEAERLPMSDVRRLFADVWLDGRDSIDEHTPGLLSMLHWIAPVRDIETYLSGTLTVFRAADGRGIRWTLDESTAAADASRSSTELFRGAVAASDVLGHFTGNGNNEVLVDPQYVASVEPLRYDA